MADERLVGSINLAKLKNAGIMTIKGSTSTKKCIVIPIEDNDIFVKISQKTAQNGQTYIDRKYNLGIDVRERDKVGQYGDTHYIKLTTSKEWIKSHSQEELTERNAVFLGDMKPMAFQSNNQASSVEAPVAETEETSGTDNLPF